MEWNCFRKIRRKEDEKKNYCFYSQLYIGNESN